MKIIQVADLHINKEIQIDNLKNKLERLFHSLESELKMDEQIIFCVCGDIVDKGQKEMYSKAEEIFNYVEKLFEDYKLKFEFVPGNHDLIEGDFKSYDDFISNFLEKPYCYNETHAHLQKYDNLNLILSNSVYHRDKSFGKLDLNSLRKIRSETPALLVIHHTLLSENDNDYSAIRNAYGLLDYIEGNNIIGVLHGHTHGYKDIKIGSQCKVIGVGPMFKEVSDINNQFNLIKINYGIISEIINYRYSADLDSYGSHLLYTNNASEAYKGDSLKQVYDKVVMDTKRLNCIHNLKMNVSTRLEDFEKEIMESFADTISIAEDWQKKTVPESLYYNHGKYMQSKGIWGIDYIVEELDNKTTSSRAIIPLINFCDVVDSGDQFLPSLDIVQFGFADNFKKKIFITIYLRALEVNHFLKINLCEVYLMIKDIADRIRSITEIDMTILAFKAQHKERYGCFRKARIDIISEAKLTTLLLSNKHQEIIEMLEEKLELNETVIQDKGLLSLENAIKVLVDEKKYSKELLEKIENILKELDGLKTERTKTSHYKEIEELEQLVTNSINELIAELKKEGCVQGGH